MSAVTVVEALRRMKFPVARDAGNKDQPRGKPDNAGQFAKVPGGGSSGKAGEKIKESASNNPENNTGRSRNNAPVTELSGNELDIKPGESVQDAAIRYYDALRNNPAEREGFGKVEFTRKGRDKLTSASLPEQERLKLLPAVKPLIEKGDYIGRHKLEKERKDGVVAFHYFEGNVTIGKEKKFIGVSVYEDKSGNKFYNLVENPDVLLAKKKTRQIAQDSAGVYVPFGDSVSEAFNLIIMPNSEKVNGKFTRIKGGRD